jgi:hypothetical protein
MNESVKLKLPEPPGTMIFPFHVEGSFRVVLVPYAQKTWFALAARVRSSDVKLAATWVQNDGVPPGPVHA